MMTDERIAELADEHSIGGVQGYGLYPYAFARAIEAEVRAEELNPAPLYAAPQPPAPCPKCENAARRSEYWKAEHLAANSVITELHAEVAEINERIAETVAAERERCARIVSAPHWKPAVRQELAKRAAAIRAGESKEAA